MSVLKERILGLIFRILIRSIDLLASRYGLSKEECDNFYRLAHAHITFRELWESLSDDPHEQLPIDANGDKEVQPPKFRRTYSGEE